eukprot:CAMPEP_0204514810 /NCGR_PEP_ID=MMETSP0661-20131031/2283_1 /ASSEMBLY_ACC=CAM_ASM_000606 /TAXON_ID=109239 /ORGANISM="Alexandrium margalefi, Strain AMGDE01CS-322" /LENGTH=135 /DNA_ID=CAMNT_0051520087 /DNA_START=116 /DNA_END=519 /DNA_ORIENTATION=+
MATTPSVAFLGRARRPAARARIASTTATATPPVSAGSGTAVGSFASASTTSTAAATLGASSRAWRPSTFVLPAVRTTSQQRRRLLALRPPGRDGRQPLCEWRVTAAATTLGLQPGSGGPGTLSYGECMGEGATAT